MTPGEDGTWQPAEDEVDANPTKALFVTMLTRDVDLMGCINDLVDNSMDGARRLKPEGGWSDLAIKIEVSGERFRIVDNCGGIPIEKARDYAFRFGRDDKALQDTEKGDIGMFGVGMKRAIFKMGRAFVVGSSHPRQSFHIREDDLDEWVRDSSYPWKFHLEKGLPVAWDDLGQAPGTRIDITQLTRATSEAFGRQAFVNGLIEDLERAHREALSGGIQIWVNDAQAAAEPIELAVGPRLVPIDERRVIETEEGEVRVRIVAGVHPNREPSRAGWSIYCNRRQIVHADRSILTGWGDQEQKVRNFHNEFSPFRGVVFLEADNPAALPWNTSKTALDHDSPVYQEVRYRMVAAMKEVLRYLSDLQKERSETSAGPLGRALEKAKMTEVADLSASADFKRPAAQTREKLVSVQFKVRKEQADAARDDLGASSYTEMGDMLFRRYLREAGLDERYA